MSVTALRVITCLLLAAVLAASAVILAPAAQSAGARSSCASLTAAFPWKVRAAASLTGRKVQVTATPSHPPMTTVTARDSRGRVLSTRNATGTAPAITVPPGTVIADVAVRWNVPSANDPICRTRLTR